jgi:hypothetical protein
MRVALPKRRYRFVFDILTPSSSTSTAQPLVLPHIDFFLKPTMVVATSARRMGWHRLFHTVIYDELFVNVHDKP